MTTAVLMVLALGHATLIGQSAVVGRVVDSAGQPLPGVTVTAIPADGGALRRTTITAVDGGYRFEMLPDGMYRLDFRLQGFASTRRNHVRVRGNVRTAFADATLRIRAICECVSVSGLPPTIVRSGRVVNDAGQPLPRARLEIVIPLPASPVGVAGSSQTWREVTYTDEDGRFFVLAPVGATWPVTASDSGFPPVTQQVSGSRTEPLVFTLRYLGGPPGVGAPEYEILSGDDCGCEGNLFTNRPR